MYYCRRGNLFNRKIYKIKSEIKFALYFYCITYEMLN